MATRPLVLFPNPWLKTVCQTVDIQQDCWQTWANALQETLSAYPGVGIAAPQLGILKQIIIIDERRYRHPPPTPRQWVLINPKIIAHAGKTITREGCLSIPGYLGDTIRAKRVELTAWDAQTQSEIFLNWRGFAAVVAQHEIDHLHGILFLDRLIETRAALKLRGIDVTQT